LRFWNGNGICAISLHYLAKFWFQQLKPFAVARALLLDTTLRLAAANAIRRAVSIEGKRKQNRSKCVTNYLLKELYSDCV